MNTDEHGSKNHEPKTNIPLSDQLLATRRLAVLWPVPSVRMRGELHQAWETYLPELRALILQ